MGSQECFVRIRGEVGREEALEERLTKTEEWLRQSAEVELEGVEMYGWLLVKRPKGWYSGWEVLFFSEVEHTEIEWEQVVQGAVERLYGRGVKGVCFSRMLSERGKEAQVTVSWLEAVTEVQGYDATGARDCISRRWRVNRVDGESTVEAIESA